LSSLSQDLVERAKQAAGVGATIGAPIQKPNRPRIVAIDGFHDELRSGVAVFITADGALLEKLARGKFRIVLDEPRVAFTVSIDHHLDEAVSIANLAQILAVANFATIDDDALNVPFIRINEKADHRLLIVGIAAGVSFDDQPRPRGVD
jgi:hypothetical protein